MAENLNTVYRQLVNAVYSDDMKSQEYYLSMVQSHRNIPVDYLLSRGCLFIPNNEYIKHYIGSLADTYGCDLYREE